MKFATSMIFAIIVLWCAAARAEDLPQGCLTPERILHVSYPTGPSHAEAGLVEADHFAIQLWGADVAQASFRTGDRITACKISDAVGFIGANFGPLSRESVVLDMDTRGSIKGLLRPDYYLAMFLPHPSRAWYRHTWDGTGWNGPGDVGPFSDLHTCHGGGPNGDGAGMNPPPYCYEKP